MITDITTTPGTPTTVLTVAKAKKHLRLDASFAEEDDLIQDYIDAAVVYAENYIGGNITDKNIVFKCDAFISPFIFEAFPIKSVTSVKYFEPGNQTEITLDAANYALTSQNLKTQVIRFKNDLPEVEKRFDAVTIIVNVGMATIEKPIVSAVMLMVADMYERREDRPEVLSTAAMSLLRPYKKF